MGDTEITFRPQRFNRKRSTVANTVEKASLEKAKPYGERIKYSREFLLALMEKFTSPLTEVAQRNLPEILRTEDSVETQLSSMRSQLQSVPKREPRDTQEDWHSGKKAIVEPPRQQDTWDHKPVQDKNVPAAPTSPIPQSVDPRVAAGKIQTAAELGRQAYRPGGFTMDDRTFRAMVGIINKLTPENYERLSIQLIDSIGDSKLLQQTLSFTFDNAVKQPSYCPMYAKLCRDLQDRLPRAVFGPEAQSVPWPVKSMLLNTCQEELESAIFSYKQASSNPDTAKVEEVTAGLRKRIIGIVRLICEIYKLNVLPDKPIFELFSLLQSSDCRGNRYLLEDTIEAVCEALTLTGYKLSCLARPDLKVAFKKILTHLSSMTTNKNVSSRIRFCIDDVMELSRKNWVSGKESTNVKKVSEINAQARAELGLVDISNITEFLPALPAQQKQAHSNARDYSPLFPEYKGSVSNEKFSGRSALIGDFKERPAASSSSRTMSKEDTTRKAKGLYEEYCSTLDEAEAVTCFRELRAGGGDIVLVLETGINYLLDSVKDREQMAIIDLFSKVHKAGVAQQEDLLSAVTTFIIDLQDISVDTPLAPKLLGKLYGSLVANKIFELTLSDLFADDADNQDRVMDGLVKRDFCAAVLKYVKTSVGADALKSICADVKFSAKALFEANPEVDGDLPPVEDFLKAEGLSDCVPL